MQEVATAVTVAESLEKLGVIAILGLLCVWLGYLYLQERKKTDKLTEKILTEATESTREMVAAIASVEAAIQGFRMTLDAIRPYLKKDPL